MTNYIGGMALTVLINLYEVFVMRYIWLWFILPEWGFKVPSYVALLGVNWIWSLFSESEVDPTKLDDNVYVFGKLKFVLLRPLTVFILGWLVHTFVNVRF